MEYWQGPQLLAGFGGNGSAGDGHRLVFNPIWNSVILNSIFSSNCSRKSDEFNAPSGIFQPLIHPERAFLGSEYSTERSEYG
jgi:hypothetical protein